ncbi:MAG TPA: hypothetical protein VFB13_20590 [Reyranella sp.]|jgi:hypothetical protein|nr:hypothetical protein [Reyranella sp.]
MIMRSMLMAAVAAVLAAGTASAQGQMQAVPRAGVAFPYTVTVRAKVESVDVDTRTIAFMRTDGRLINCAVSDSVRNLAEIQDDANVDVTYNLVVTLLNLRQKGPGSREARREAGNRPDKDDIEMGRFTLTVVAVDLPNNKVSVISGQGGEVRTLAATSIAQKDAIGKIKVGDVVIGMTTPLTVTAIAPVK